MHMPSLSAQHLTPPTSCLSQQAKDLNALQVSCVPSAAIRQIFIDFKGGKVLMYTSQGKTPDSLVCVFSSGVGASVATSAVQQSTT